MSPWRLYLVLFFLFCMGALVSGRLVFLQIVNHGFYKALAQGQRSAGAPMRGERGTVFLQDKQGNLYALAANQKILFAFISPAELKKKDEAVKALSEILQLESESILPRLQNQESYFEILKKPITDEEAQQIRNLKIAGIYVGLEQKRSYPQGTLAAHVIGFTNQDGEGQYGIEESSNAQLEGKEGMRASLKNPAHYLLSALTNVSKDGQDIVLTVDYNIQSVAESLLENAQTRLKIEGGTIIVMDPTSGKILTLANTPSFDPNAYAKVENLEVFQNSAIQKIHEPGSVFKAFTMAAALNEAAITPDTTYRDTGFAQIGARKITNYDQHVWGEQTMTQVLEHSINTGAVFAERQLGNQKFLEYIEDFGFFEPTNVELAGEIFSRNAEFRKGYEINFATASFGQGIEMTPLQVARAFSALANNGALPNPYIIEENENKNQKQIIAPRTASQITSMLVSVVQNGFAKSAQIAGYSVAGKTGTAQISWSALGVAKSGYSDKTTQSFVGYAPAFDPKFLILVKLDNPAARTAEYSAVPIFHDLAKYIIDYYQIPPDLTS